ncbi:hypothetical protein [Lysinibacillus pakistanensis]|uniref:hypothetical protein n=1 Tax=Lysinibacillus pakistanensis TaxID=759811 RepID=UPI003D27579A
MGHSIEFYDVQGNLTRKGRITNTKVAAMVEESDYRFVVRSDVYPFSIVKEGFFKKSGVSDLKTQIGAFSVSKYNEIEFILNKEIEDIKYYINNEAVDFQQIGALITAPNTPGTHKIVHPKSGMEVYFRIKDMRSLKAIKALSDNKETEELIAKVLIDYRESDLSLHEILVDLLKNGSKESILHYQRILAKFEAIYNQAVKTETATTWFIENQFDCNIIPNNEINKVIVYMLDRDKKIFKKAIKIVGETSIVLDPHKIYLIEGYNDDLFVSSRVLTTIPASSRTEKWKEAKLNEERLNYLIQRGHISSSGIPEEIEEEIYLLSSESIVSSRYGSPTIIDNIDKIIFEFEDYFLADDFEEVIYLCVATKKQFVNREYWFKTEIKTNEIAVEVFDSGLLRDETYLVWIENHQGDKVSEFNIIFPEEVLEEHSTIFHDYFVHQEKEVIVEKINNAKKEQFEKLIVDYYTLFGNGINRITRLTGLIGELFKQGTWEKVHTVISIIYEVLTKSDIKIDSFFESNIKFSKWNRRMTIPETKRNFVLIVHSFNDYTKRVSKYIINNPTHFDIPEEYAIIQFLDLNENVSSQYAFIGGKNKNLIDINRGLEIEVIDDVHVRYKK